MEHVALKTLCSILCFVWGGVQLWKKFSLVKVLKNILWLTDIYVFLPHVGKGTVGWFYLELN